VLPRRPYVSDRRVYFVVRYSQVYRYDRRISGIVSLARNLHRTFPCTSRRRRNWRDRRLFFNIATFEASEKRFISNVSAQFADPRKHTHPVGTRARSPSTTIATKMQQTSKKTTTTPPNSIPRCSIPQILRRTPIVPISQDSPTGPDPSGRSATSSQRPHFIRFAGPS
jgi:hypothetical protein